MIALLAALALGQPELDAALSSAVKRTIERSVPSVVRIDRVGAQPAAALTGVAIHSDGLIATSAHAFESGLSSLAVTLHDGRKTAAKLLGIDKVLHVAFLKIEAKPPPIAAARPEAIRVGRYAVAIGRGLTETPTVSLGVISATGRVFGKAIQTDAKTSPTNYGGPLLDLDGNALGVIVPLSPEDGGMGGTSLYDSGIGFAIPMSDVLRSVERLKKGKMDQGLLGLAWRGKKPLDGPLEIEGLAWNSPAAAAGLRRGDVIKVVNGKPINFYSQFRSALGKLYADDSVKIEAARGDKPVVAVVRAVAKLPVYRPPFLGLRLKLKGKLTVESVEGPAAAADLKPKDVLVELDGPVTSLLEVEAKLAAKSAGDAFALAIERDGKREVKAVRSAAWPQCLPAPALDKRIGSAALQEMPPPMKHWVLTPATSSLALVVVVGRAKVDDWKAASARYGVAVLGFDAGIEPEVMKMLSLGYQKTFNLDRRLTAVFAAGPEAESLANALSPTVGGVAADGGPVAPPPAQPDDVRRYLILTRSGGGSLLETIKVARENGVPITEEALPDSKPESAADAVARWAAGLGRF